MKMTNRLRVVIDTNVLLVAIAERSKYHWLYQLILQNKFDVFITNEILSEYAEKILQKLSWDTANATLRTLIELENIHQTIIHYNFDLIKADTDDNKFVDCAITANVDFLVSNDKHFNILKETPFPKVNVVRIEEFESVLIAMMLI